MVRAGLADSLVTYVGICTYVVLNGKGKQAAGMRQSSFPFRNAIIPSSSLKMEATKTALITLVVISMALQLGKLVDEFIHLK